MEAVKRTSAAVLLLAFVVTVAGRRTGYLERRSSGTGYADGHVGLSEDLQSFRDLMDKRFDKLQSIIVAQMDYFCKRLEVFDTKLDRLEASVVDQLSKISEIFVSHEVQNDEASTNTENNGSYEVLERKLWSLEEKQQLALEKIEGTADSIAKRLEKMEQQIKERDSNLEAEISYVIASLDVVKGKQATLDSKLGNPSSTLNMTKHLQKLLLHFHTDEKKHMNKLHDNIISSLVYLDNKTSEHFMISEENNHLLQPLKKELKEDFNNYANKVADMTSDLGTSTLQLRDSFVGLETQVNGLEKGIKAVIGMVGLGGEKNGSIVCEDESIQEVMRTKFEKVLANQEEFMKGCYKVQMQEPQIEGEISAMLEKLLDMLVKRFGENDRDARVFKHLIKNHHEQTQRNLVQINENIASVYGRSTSSIQEIEEVIEDVQENVKALYTYLKGALPEGKNQHFEVILDKLHRIEEYTKMFKGWPEGVKPELKSIQNALTSMMKAIKPVNEKPKNQDAETARAIQDVFGTASSSSNASTTTMAWDPTKINIRGDLALNGHPSNNDAKTTGTAKSGTSQAGTTVPSTDDKSDTSVIEIVISLQNSTKTSDDADEQAVHSLQKLSGENAGTSQNSTTVSPTDNKSTKLTGVAPEKAVSSLQNASQDAGTSQNGTTVSPTDNNSATTVAEKVTSLQNDTQPSNNLAEKALLSNVSTGTLQNVTIVPPKDENKSTTVEAVTSGQNGTKPSTDMSKKAVEPLQNALKGNTTSQNGTGVPSTDNENESTVAEVQKTLKGNSATSQGTAAVPGTLQNDTTAVEGVTPQNNITEPSNSVPENVEASSQNSLIGNTETFGNDTTFATTENENTVVTMITPFENTTKPSNDSAPENVEASSQNAVKDMTVLPMGNKSNTTIVAVVKSLQNTTELSNDASEATIGTLLNSTVSSDGETRKITETTTALVSSSTAPSHDESGITDNEPGKNADKIEKPSKNISTIPTDNGSDGPDIASTTPLPKSSKAQSSDSEDDFSYRTLQAPN